MIALSVSPSLFLEIAAPPQPESLLTTPATRGSFAAAQSAVLPRRECPWSQIRFGSTSGNVKSRSQRHRKPKAHADIAV